MLAVLALLSFVPSPLLSIRAPRAPTLRPQRAAISAAFSPAYDTTIRYAAADWAKNLRTLPRSLVLRRISSPLLFNAFVTLVVCTLHAINPARPPLLVPLPHTLLGSALGLLLVFRTNAAYDRFWEARKQWGIVTSECRSLASLACREARDGTLRVQRHTISRCSATLRPSSVMGKTRTRSAQRRSSIARRGIGPLYCVSMRSS